MAQNATDKCLSMARASESDDKLTIHLCNICAHARTYGRTLTLKKLSATKVSVMIKSSENIESGVENIST